MKVFLSAATLEELEMGKNKLKADEKLQALLGLFRFLKNMHYHSDALIDFKQSDMLLAHNADSEEYELGNPMFYDMGSVLTIDREYAVSDIITGTNRPSAYKKGDNAIVDRTSENEAFLLLCNEMLSKCQKDISEVIWKKLKSFINPKDGENISRKDEEMEKGLEELRTDIQREEYDFKSKKLQKKEHCFKLLQILITLIVLAVYILIGIVLSYLCVNAEAVHSFIDEKGISPITIALYVFTRGN